MSKIDVDIQIASQADNLPEEASLSTWCEKALMDDSKEMQEVTVRIVDEDESAELNYEYRSKEGSTNVLSFPFEAPPEVEINLLGDLIICAPVVAREAKEQGKSLEAHWAHMVIHGMLHLQGYDHIDDAEAEVMEGIETKIILALGYPAPYENDNDRKNGN